jgi:hypothetical protein
MRQCLRAREMDQGGADDFQKDAGKFLVDFTDNVGTPERLITDGATEFISRHTELITEVRRMHHVTCEGTRRMQESESCGRTRNRLASAER